MHEAEHPKLYDKIDALDWPTIAHEPSTSGTAAATAQFRAPGRSRVPGAAPVPGRAVHHPHRRERPKGSASKKVKIRSAVAVLGVTSLSAREATPEHLAGYVRGHWSIENKIHWGTSDVTLRGGRQIAETVCRIMATLRNLAIGLIRQAGYTRIAATIRKIRNNRSSYSHIRPATTPKPAHDQQKGLCACALIQPGA